MSNIKVFEDKKIRAQWNEKEEDWYFSVVDIVSVLTDKDYDNARKYWKVLKGRLKNEGSELVSFCYQLKLLAQDGKLRETDVLNTKGILRLVQSIPSPKAEPFKMWLAQVGSDSFPSRVALAMHFTLDEKDVLVYAFRFERYKFFSCTWAFGL